MRTVTIEEARARLGDVVDHARLAGEPTMITRYGRPAAMVVGTEWFREAEECLAGTAGTINGPSGGQDDH
jgi:prevent-host-death family protein